MRSIRDSTCRLCKANVYWSAAATGNPVCLDESPAYDGNIAVIAGTAVSKGTMSPGELAIYHGQFYTQHAATCPVLTKEKT